MSDIAAGGFWARRGRATSRGSMRIVVILSEAKDLHFCNLALRACGSHLSRMRRLLLLLAPAALSAQSPRWLATWSFSNFAAPPVPRGDTIDRVPTYANRTLRQIVRVSVGGSELRLR